MDILQWLKQDHVDTQILLGELATCLTQATADSSKVRQLFDRICHRILGRIGAESELVLPEMADRFQGAGVLVDLCHANHRVLLKCLKQLAVSLDKKGVTVVVADLEKVRSIHSRNLTLHETQLFPKLRQSIPTGEREDIGQLVADFLSEYRREGVDIIAELNRRQKSSRSESLNRARA